MCLSAGQATAQQRGENPFDTWDKNDDGYLSREEFPARLARRLFDRIDRDQDGRISRQEDDAFREGNRNRQPSNRQPGNRQTARSPQLPAGVTLLGDVTYASVADRKLPLDLYYRPQAEKPVPVVIWIHGGGWRKGSKSGAGPAIECLQHGYAVASVEYRLSGEAIFPAAIEDCKAAVSFLRLHAKKYNLDPDRFGVWGSSAGGHLVALLGTTSDVDDFDTHPVTGQADARVQAVCNWFGPTDFLRMNDFPSTIDHDRADSPESKFIGGPIQQNQAKVRQANPITYVSPSDPPMLLVHGDQDALVAFNQSELLHQALTAAGVDSTLEKVSGGDHGFRRGTPSRAELVRRSIEFFDRIFPSDPAPAQP
jgi:acetyl esterase/lipase